MNIRSVTLILALTIHAPLSAGLWDVDRPERNDLPPLQDAITGRFERRPAQFYAQRLARLKPEIEPALNADNALPKSGADDLLRVLPLFDDVCVAQFRLGQYGDAIITADRKLLQIERIRKFNETAARTHEIHALANKAECLKHRWDVSGDDADLRVARSTLERVLEIDRHNWDAGWSLTEIEWLLSSPAHDAARDSVLPNLLGLTDADFQQDLEPGALARGNIDGCIEFLTRHIVYERGWENVDVMYALSLGLALSGQRRDAAFAYLRVAELLDSGASTLVQNNLDAETLKQRMGIHLGGIAADLHETWLESRRESDAYMSSRSLYLNRKLDNGEHPDIDANFWGAWRLEEANPPTPGPKPEDAESATSLTAILGGAGALVGVIVLLFLGVMLLGRNKSPHPTVDEL